MSFQQRPQRRAPRCPWCDQEMVSSPDSRGGRLFCPTGEPVEYRLSGGRWYFNGRLNGLEEPIPPAPYGEDVPDEEEARPGRPVSEPRPASTVPPRSAADPGRPPVAMPPATAAPIVPSAPAEPLDTLDAFRQIASEAWGRDGGEDDDAAAG